ncbi:MAG: hypothetical protein JXL67_04740 [Calditrichaeota bacterium]|nr:hypothetical protein [Calditrichota bacterium]
MFTDLFENLHFTYIFCTAVLFIAGIYFAPTIVDKNIRWMLRYPRWVASLMERYFSVRWGFFFLFLIIFILNNMSLFLGFLSGFLIVLPLFFAFFTGFNVAVISYDLMGWKGIWHMLMNPIAWLEFPAAWLSFGMGMKIGVTILTSGNFTQAVSLFNTLLPIYGKYVLVLLLIAALLESGLIVLAEKHKDDIS